MKNGAVYPRWHPSGKFVAFSSNKIVQQFHSALNKKVEVSDLESSLVLYDMEKNEIMDIDLSGKGEIYGHLSRMVARWKLALFLQSAEGR